MFANILVKYSFDYVLESKVKPRIEKNSRTLMIKSDLLTADAHNQDELMVKHVEDKANFPRTISKLIQLLMCCQFRTAVQGYRLCVPVLKDSMVNKNKLVCGFKHFV